jgi:hypothetical protein
VAYQHITYSEYLRRLSSGQYLTVTAARRAITKTCLSAEEVARGRKVINKRFGTTERKATHTGGGKMVIDKRSYSGSRPDKVLGAVVSFLSLDRATRKGVLAFMEDVEHTRIPSKRLRMLLADADKKLRSK